MRQDLFSLTLSKPQSLELFSTSADCGPFISKFLPCAKILKRGFPHGPWSSVYIGDQWDGRCPCPCSPFMSAALYFCLKHGIWAFPWKAAGDPICTTQLHSLRPHCFTKVGQEFGSSFLLIQVPSASFSSHSPAWGWGWGASPLCLFKRLFDLSSSFKNYASKTKS